jgi:regulator of protease activity HflC (stomatin/prohibitin superfamily)
MYQVIALTFLALVVVSMAVKVVPQQKAYIAERLGKFNGVLQPGINFIIPFFDKIAYKHSLKEQAYDIHEQICITRDNVQVRVDGVIFLQVVDPQKASYGINLYHKAYIFMRSEILCSSALF